MDRQRYPHPTVNLKRYRLFRYACTTPRTKCVIYPHRCGTIHACDTWGWRSRLMPGRADGGPAPGAELVARHRLLPALRADPPGAQKADKPRADPLAAPGSADARRTDARPRGWPTPMRAAPIRPAPVRSGRAGRPRSHRRRVRRRRRNRGRRWRHGRRRERGSRGHLRRWHLRCCRWRRCHRGGRHWWRWRLSRRGSGFPLSVVAGPCLRSGQQIALDRPNGVPEPLRALGRGHGKRRGLPAEPLDRLFNLLGGRIRGDVQIAVPVFLLPHRSNGTARRPRSAH